MEANMAIQESEALRLLAVAAFRYYLATVAASEGGPMPRLAMEREQLLAPQPGDWVMEISTIWDPRSDFDRIGRLILMRNEVVPYADEDEQEAVFNDYKEVRERFTYIERLDGTVFRWHNCEFIRVFEDIRSDEEIEAALPSDDDSWRSDWLASARLRHGL